MHTNSIAKSTSVSLSVMVWEWLFVRPSSFICQNQPIEMCCHKHMTNGNVAGEILLIVVAENRFQICRIYET